MNTTVGQILINEALPEDMRDYSRRLDKPGLKKLMQEVAEKYPDRYREVSQRLMMVGQSAATTGNFSFSLRDFQPPKAKRDIVSKLKIQAQSIVDDPKLDKKQKHEKITMLLGQHLDKITKATLEDAHKSGSRLADVILSGSKGSPSQFNTTVGAPLMYTDHKDQPVPIPVFNSVSEGLDPVEYWASTYGTRKGVISTKFATAEAGYFGKKLGLAANRLVVTDDDCGTSSGILTDGDDRENVGTVLAQDVGNIKAGTVLTPSHLSKLKGKKILTRSPMTCQAEHGLCAKCSGIRERGTFPELGDNLGVSAASALSERLSQSMLNVKHTAGAAGAKRSYGYEDVERLFEMPQHSTEFAPVAEEDGVVKEIKDSPTGGVFVKMGDSEYWAASKDRLSVKVGDHVEAGDMLAAGIPNPTLLAKHRGIGDARHVFMNNIREVTNNNISRRNAEVLARALISHVNIMSMKGPAGTIIGDTPRYDDIAKEYEPREGSKELPVGSAAGGYLETPVLHYSIGTRINNRVAKVLKDNGVKNITVHKDPPDFEPDVQRMFSHSQLDPDWMTRMSGYHLKSSIPEAVHRGLTSQEHSTSFVPSLARGVEFGEPKQELGLY